MTSDMAAGNNWSNHYGGEAADSRWREQWGRCSKALHNDARHALASTRVAVAKPVRLIPLRAVARSCLAMKAVREQGVELSLRCVIAQ